MRVMEPEKLTVDELARQEGLPTSTVRLYVHDGLLGRPVREGRRAFYSTAHVRRLRSIRRLLERGFSLAAIRQMFELDDMGGELATLLHGDEEAVELDPAQFASLFPDGEIDADVLREAVALGVLVADDKGIRFADKRHLKNALALAELGVPGAVGLEAWKRTKQLVASIVAEFVSLAASALPENDEHLAGRLLALGSQTVQLAYEAEVRELGYKLPTH